MDLSATKDLLFRHGEKLLLAVVILFVGYQVYANLFRGETDEVVIGGPAPAQGPEATDTIDPRFYGCAEPFIRVPGVTPGRYNWFHSPRTDWRQPIELIEKKKDLERRVIRGKAIGTPVVSVLTDEEMKAHNVSKLPDILKEPCTVTATIERGTEEDKDTLVIKGETPGTWLKILVTLENQDKVCVPVCVLPVEIERERQLAKATILGIKEEPLGTLVVRFTAPEGSIKSSDGSREITYVEPTYFVVLRKGELDSEEAEVGRFGSRHAKEPETPPVGPTPPPRKEHGGHGFPGAVTEPAKKAPPPVAPKAAPPAEPGVLVFVDRDVEAETSYTYRIKSLYVPEEDGEKFEPRFSEAKSEKTLPRFSFAYVGGDANMAHIIVFIGPREQPLGVKSYERIPVGSYVGDMPKELRAAAGGAVADDPAASRFVTRCILVDIEQDAFRPVPHHVRKPDGVDGLGRPVFRDVLTYRESFARRVILRDFKRNRLFHVWFEPRSTVVVPPGK